MLKKAVVQSGVTPSIFSNKRVSKIIDEVEEPICPNEKEYGRKIDEYTKSLIKKLHKK